jgi:hypothetical protein
MPDIPDAELTNLRAQAEAGQSAAAALDVSQQNLAATATALLETTRTANPTIPPDLIAGDTPAAIAASVTSAQATVAQVLAANTSSTPAPGAAPPASPPVAAAAPAPVPAGAPPRSDPNEPPAGVTGVARIQHALRQRSQGA